MWQILAAGAVSAIGTLMGGNAQAKAQQQAAANAIRQGAYNRMISEYNGEQIRQQSQRQAEKIIAAGERMRSQQQVAQAASGIVIGEGSAAAVADDTRNLAAEDALVTLYTGIEGQVAQLQEGNLQYRAAENQYSAGMAAAKATKTSALFSAVGTMANAYSSYNAIKVNQ